MLTAHYLVKKMNEILSIAEQARARVLTREQLSDMLEKLANECMAKAAELGAATKNRRPLKTIAR